MVELKCRIFGSFSCRLFSIRMVFSSRSLLSDSWRGSGSGGVGGFLLSTNRSVFLGSCSLLELREITAGGSLVGVGGVSFVLLFLLFFLVFKFCLDFFDENGKHSHEIDPNLF